MIIYNQNKKVAKINGVDFPIEATEKKLESFHVEDAKELLQRLKIMDDMLTNLGVTKALNVSNISDKEDNYIKMPITAFVENKTIRFKENTIHSVGGISIGNIYLILHFRQNEDGSYLIENSPDIKYEVSGVYKNGEMFDTSKYVIMKADNVNCKIKRLLIVK